MWRNSCFYILPVLLVLGRLCHAQDTLVLSLDSCLAYAYEHNSTMLTSRLAQERATVSLHSSRQQFLPSINASASEFWSRNGDQHSRDLSLGASVSLTLFNGLSNWNNYRQSRLSLQQSYLQTLQSQRTVGEAVENAYFTLLMHREKQAYLRQHVELCRQQQEEGRQRLAAGKMLESEYQLLQANLWQTQNELNNLALTIEECRWSLHILLNLPETVMLDVPPLEVCANDTLLPSLETVTQQALTSLPDLKIAQMDVTMARYSLRTARAAFLPTLSLSAGSSYYGGNQGLVDALGRFINKGGLNSNLGLSLSIPIYNHGQAFSQVKQGKIALRQAEVAQQQKAQELRQSVRKMYVSTLQSLNNYRVAQQRERVYRMNYEVYRKRYDEGKINIVDLLQQQDSFLGALNEYLQNKYTFMLNRKLLDLAMTTPKAKEQ